METTTENWKPRYFSVFTGQALSQIGSAVTQFVLMWWIASTTKDVGAMATAGIFALLPQAILGPIGGILADRYSRRLIMIVSDSITALCMVVLISLFANNTVELWHIYALLFIRSSMQAFQGPASQASTVMLVPASFLPRAAGLNQSIISLMTIAAAPVGALAMSTMSFQGALMIDVVTACLGILPLLIFKIPQPARSEIKESAWTEFKEGLNLVWHAKPLRQLYSLNAIIVLILMPCFTLVPLLIVDHFKGGANHVAVMEGLAGIAMLMGGVATTIYAPSKKVITFLIGLGLGSFAVAATALMPEQSFVIATVFWVASGFLYSYANTPIIALLQLRIPPQLQGRAFSLLTTTTALASPIGLSLFGPIGSYIGIRNIYIIAGIITGVICLLSLKSRELRNLEGQDFLQ